jgi:hypothetical protein
MPALIVWLILQAQIVYNPPPNPPHRTVLPRNAQRAETSVRHETA